ncbi:ABC transporter substrate-binding protein [Paenibacillus sacheonensis]|nr:ABC transporter substrate-binding protein [Paenibacillus sacheonensis]MBM7569313.1 NitT/TauT family transport system substrate-binding protein [Paenibacillus sacheonensis]
MYRQVDGTGIGMLLILLSLAGCGTNAKNDPGSNAKPAANATTADPANTASAAADEPAAGTPASTNPADVTLIEGWYAKGEDGGYFAGLQQNYYRDAGVNMTITPGGPQISAMTLVASGKADFGISYADDILLARQQGIPVVGILAGFQYSPQVLIHHADDKIESFADIGNRTVYVTPGTLYWEYIKSKFKLTKAKPMAYTGQLVNFIKDKKSLNQGYITNEPYALANQGVDVSLLKVADSGYANYADVLFTTEDYLAKHPDVVKAVVQASQKGWSYYLDNYKTVNPLIKTYNPEATLDAMDYEAEHEKEFILTDETKANGIGAMTVDRWNQLQDQLIEIKGLKEKQDVTTAFTTEFLAKP